MRRQNPPQSSLDQAYALERYLKPMPLGVIYLLCATIGFAVVVLLFAVLVSGYLLNPTRPTTALFALLALAPGALALVEFRRRPNDLLSVCIGNLANSRRQPIDVATDRCTFKVLLMTGETLCVNLWFHYPAKNHVPEVRERINAYVRLSLERDCSMRADLPSEEDILRAVDRGLDTVAAEFGIPVLYSEVRDMHKIRDAYSKLDDLTASEYLGVATGTLG